MVRANLLRKVGGFDKTLRCAVDWDLVLRLSLHTDLPPRAGSSVRCTPRTPPATIGSQSAKWFLRAPRSEPATSSTGAQSGLRRARTVAGDRRSAPFGQVSPRRSTGSTPFARSGWRVVTSSYRWSRRGRHENIALSRQPSAEALASASLTATPKDVGIAVATDLALAKATGSVFILARPSLQPVDGWLPPLLETLGGAGVACVASLWSCMTARWAAPVVYSPAELPSRSPSFATSRCLMSYGLARSSRFLPPCLAWLRSDPSDAVGCRGLEPHFWELHGGRGPVSAARGGGKGPSDPDARSRVDERPPGRFGSAMTSDSLPHVLTDRWESPPPGSRALWEAAGFIVDGYRDVELASSTDNLIRASRVDLRRYRPPATVGERPPHPSRWANRHGVTCGSSRQTVGGHPLAHGLAGAPHRARPRRRR